MELEIFSPMHIVFYILVAGNHVIYTKNICVYVKTSQRFFKAKEQLKIDESLGEKCNLCYT